MKKIIIFALFALTLSACQMDFYRSDTMTSTQLKADPSSSILSTNGNYSLFKEILDYNGSSDSGTPYVKDYAQLAEYSSDNVAMSGKTTSSVFFTATFTGNDPTAKHLTRMWYFAYKIIFSANTIIEMLPEGQSDLYDHILGENYCMRAICHMHLMQLFSTPVVRGLDKPGVVLRTSTDCSETHRSTVGECFAQIEKDLVKAAQLMEAYDAGKDGTPRGDKGYISYNTARGLLTRAYLYQQKYDECIELCNQMLGTDPAAKLSNSYSTLFSDARNNNETLWCIAKESTDTDYSPRSQIGSMYYSPDGIGGTGWLEVYSADPLIELFRRYPEDKRYQYFQSQSNPKGDGSKMIHWPVYEAGNKYRYSAIVTSGIVENADGSYSFTYSGTPYTAKKTQVNTYDAYYIEGFASDAIDDDDITGGTRVYVRDNITNAGIRNGQFPAYMCNKYSGQDGDPMLSSPIMIRWAEVVLNRAEAYAHKSENGRALDDVNVIRTHAGLGSEALMNAENIAARGYSSVLDVVLDERRLEFTHENMRTYDLYRNNKNLDRRFVGMHEWKVYTPDELDLLYPHLIPFDEVSVSGIEQNPR